jgi:hypothetical protein
MSFLQAVSHADGKRKVHETCYSIFCHVVDWVFLRTLAQLWKASDEVWSGEQPRDCLLLDRMLTSLQPCAKRLGDRVLADTEDSGISVAVGEG